MILIYFLKLFVYFLNNNTSVLSNHDKIASSLNTRALPFTYSLELSESNISFDQNFTTEININIENNDDDTLQLSRCDPQNINFNCTIDEFLVYSRGPQQLHFGTAMLLTTLSTGIFITGVVGNVLVCIIIIKHSTMHTATNYYLFSLAVSDLIFLILGLPYEISLYWHQYPYNLGLAFCKLRAYISEASTYVSVLTIAAFSVERFLAICHPLHLHTMSGFKRALRIITVLWIISFLSATPFAVFTKVDFLRYPVDNSIIHKSAFCAMLENPESFPLWEFSTILFFVIPMITIMVLYGRMGYQIRIKTKRFLASENHKRIVRKESQLQQSRKSVIKMLAAVVITFFLCWAPFHAQRLFYLYAKDSAFFQELNIWLFYIGGWFYYVSCTINPILYNLMSHRYRAAFKKTLCGKKWTYYQNFELNRKNSSFQESGVHSCVTPENTQFVCITKNSLDKRNSQPVSNSGRIP